MQNQIQNVSFSDQITLDNPNKIAWGPNNFLAIASENVVTVYQLRDKKLEIFHKITRHKAKVTALSWNFPTVEFYKPNSFDILLAVGDEDGNCLIYDMRSLSRRGGISPDSCSTSFSIWDIKWKIDDPSTLFITTAQPSLISISIGTTENLNRSKMTSIFINSTYFHSINITLLWLQDIEPGYKRISLDLFDPNRILITSPQSLTFFAMKIIIKNRQNAYYNSVSEVLRFPINENQKLLHAEYFPFKPNCLLLLTDHNLYLFNLFTNAISTIISYNNLRPFCICSGIFSHSISDRFWMGTIDGSIYRYTINDTDENNNGDIGDNWVVDCLLSSPKAQNLLGIFSDSLNPSQICAVYKDCIAIVKEIPNIQANHKSQNSNQEQKQNLKQERIQNSKQNQNARVMITRSYSQGSSYIERQNLYQILNQSSSQEQSSNQILGQNYSQSTLQDENQSINHKNKLFITSFIPCLTDQLISWTIDKGRIAFLSSTGLITILSPSSNPQANKEGEIVDHIFNYSNIDEICSRYRIDDSQTTQINFYKDDSVILNGSKIHILNYKQRGKVNEIDKKVTKFCIKEDIIAFTPTISSFELYTINCSSFTKDFASNVKLFCPCYDDKTKWVLVLSSPPNTLFIIGYVVSKRYEIDENVFGSIVSIAFAYENIYLATSKSIIHQFNLSTGEKKSVIFSSVSMRSISIYKKYILACDMSNNCSVLSAQDLSFVSTSPCFGKEIQVLNDDFCVVQTKSSSHPVFMLYKFPSLESVRAANNNLDDFRNIFWNCKNINDFEKVARKIGDLMFLQFVQIAKHEKDTILPNVYCISRSKVVENEKCIGACNIQNAGFIDEYIEYLILTEQFERAAKFALTTVNKQNILLAHACLSPNAEAVRKIMNFIPSIKGSEKVFALLLKIAGDSKEAANVASKINDVLGSIKFLKLICNDDDIKKFIRLLKIYKENYFAMAFVDDYEKAITILLNSNEISKAYAYMTLIEEKTKGNKNNNGNENDHFFIDKLKIQLDYDWKKLMLK